MPISLVNATAVGFSTTSTLDLAALNCTAGNCIVVGVAVGDDGGADEVTGITDTAGNSYTRVARNTDVNNYNCEIWFARKIIGHATNVISLTRDNVGSLRLRAEAMQFSGVENFTQAVASTPVSATSISTASWSPGAPGRLAVAVTSSSGSTGTFSADSGDGFTLGGTHNNQYASQYATSAGTSSQTTTTTKSASTTLNSVLAVFSAIPDSFDVVLPERIRPPPLSDRSLTALAPQQPAAPPPPAPDYWGFLGLHRSPPPRPGNRGAVFDPILALAGVPPPPVGLVLAAFEYPTAIGVNKAGTTMRFRETNTSSSSGTTDPIPQSTNVYAYSREKWLKLHVVSGTYLELRNLQFRLDGRFAMNGIQDPVRFRVAYRLASVWADPVIPADGPFPPPGFEDADSLRDADTAITIQAGEWQSSNATGPGPVQPFLVLALGIGRGSPGGILTGTAGVWTWEEF